MPGRIATIQRQARELGRLRMGYSEPTAKGKLRPVRSDTWIISSHSKDYVEAAAKFWGGTPEQWEPQGGGAPQWRAITDTDTLEAVLPGGDPLSQAYEMWNAGGAVRRCDGIEDRISGKKCLCIAQFGEQFYEQAKGTVCDATTRLNIFLPDMPDVGVFRVETHSYYAAQEIAGALDVIAEATGGNQMLPIKLRIEQRQRKAGGQTKKYPVPVVELRGITTGHVLTGRVQGAALESTAQRAQLTAGNGAAGEGTRQLGAGPVRHDEQNLLDAIAKAGSRDDLTALWRQIPQDARTEPVVTAFQARAAEFAPAAPGADQAAARAPRAAPGATRGTSVDALWQQIVALGGQWGWTTKQLEDDFTALTGADPGAATAAQMHQWLTEAQAPAAESTPGASQPAGEPWDGEDTAEYVDVVDEPEDQR